MKLSYITVLYLLYGYFKIIHTRNTNVYNSEWNNNKNYNFYDPNTFGINIYSDPCTKINTNQDFRKYVDANIKCIGFWCVNNKFICGRNGNTHCYHVEHIIDINGPEFDADSKNIAGNMVMAYGR